MEMTTYADDLERAIPSEDGRGQLLNRTSPRRGTKKGEGPGSALPLGGGMRGFVAV